MSNDLPVSDVAARITAPSTGPLRLALLLDAGGRCPRWMWSVLEPALSAGHIDLDLLAVQSDPHPPHPPWVLTQYSNWERRRYLKDDNPLVDVEVPPLAGRPVRQATVNELPRLLAQASAELVLLVQDVDDPQLAHIESPVWKVRFGSPSQDPACWGFWEVVDRFPSSVSLLEMCREPYSWDVLETIVYRTDPRSWIRNQLALAAKAADLLRRWLPPHPSRMASPDGFPAAHPHPAQDRRAIRGVSRLLSRFARHAVASSLQVQQWQLVVSRSTHFGSIGDPQVLTPPADRYWCDPFPFEKDNRLHVFFEEYPHQAGKGHISVMSRSTSGAWQGPVRVLEQPYHLSYPFVFEHDGELLMIPETACAGRVELYRAVHFPETWRLDRVLIEGVPAVDATLWYQDGLWWMFLDVRDELCIYYADSLRGAWRPHPRNPVKSDSRSSRPAGRIFRRGGDVIRPSQDCSVQYGRQVVFNRITRLSIADFEEVEWIRLHTPWNRNIGCHTFNQAADLTFVDRLVSRSRGKSSLRTA